MLLPSASKKLEESIVSLVNSITEDDHGSWLLNILRQLQEILKEIFYETGPELLLPPFMNLYRMTLRSHFIDTSVVILNVPIELLVGRYLFLVFSIILKLLKYTLCIAVHWQRTLLLLVVKLSHREFYSSPVTRAKRKWNAL